MSVAAVAAAAGMFAASIVAAAMEIGVGFKLSREVVLGALADVSRSPACNFYAKFRQGGYRASPYAPHISTSIFLSPNKPASAPCPEPPQEITSAPVIFPSSASNTANSGARPKCWNTEPF